MNLAQRLQELEARIEALDIAVQEVHPQYANRILDRMHELERHTRRQASQALDHMHELERLARKHCDKALTTVEKMMREWANEAEKSIARFNEAAEQHRRELGELKEVIDWQHDESTENLKRMKAMAKQAIQDIDQQKSLLEAAEAAEQRLTNEVESMFQGAEAMLRHFFSRRWQERGMEQARANLDATPNRVRAESLPAVMRDAMNIAKHRPSLLHAVSSQPAPGGQWDQASATSATSAVSASRGRSML